MRRTKLPGAHYSIPSMVLTGNKIEWKICQSPPLSNTTQIIYIKQFKEIII